MGRLAADLRPPKKLENRSDLAPRSSEKEDRLKRETFHRNPAGNQSRPAEPGQQPEASLAWWTGDRPLRSVDSEIKRCVIEPRNFLVVSLRLGQSRGPRQALATPGPVRVPGHTGVGGTWRMITGVPRELGRPCRLHRNAGRETRLTNSRMIRGPASEADGDERGTKRWYRQAKETKCGETGGRESERLIVPSKPGEPSRGTLGREGDAVS